MAGQRVRPARTEDAPAIAALVASPADLYQVAPQESYPLTAEVVSYWLSRRDGCHVMEDEGEILAYGELNPDAAQRRVWWIGHVVVQARRRGQGLGRELVGALARVAAERRMARAVWISTFADNTAGLRSYQSVGFHVMQQRQVFGRELIDLQLWLDADTRSISRLWTAIFASLAAALTLAVLPGEIRAALSDELPIDWWWVMLGCAGSGAVAGLALRRLLPDMRARGIEPLLRPFLFGTAVGVLLSLVWSLTDLLLRPGQSWAPLAVLSLGLQYGAGWGLAAVFFSQLMLRARIMVPPGPAQLSDEIPR